MTVHTTHAAAAAAHQLTVTFDRIRATAGEDTWMTTHAELLAHYPGNAPEHARTFDTLDSMRRYVDSTGSHFWDPAAVRMFRGRTHPAHGSGGLYGRRLWVESRQFVHTDSRTYETVTYPREYMVAWVSAGAGVAGVERLGSFDTLARARAAARDLAAAIVTLDNTHADYPHHPGALYDCPACEARCWCTGDPGTTECVFGADDDTTAHHGTRAAREAWAAGNGVSS
jgi:hypothetical protein